MDLILWRHGEADNNTDDLSRKLTKKGKSDALLIANFIHDKLPQSIQFMASEALRSQQTLACLNQPFDIYSELNPEESIETVLPFLYSKLNSPIICVGHLPWIGQACAQLLQNQLAVKQSHSIINVERAGLYWFNVQLNKQTAQIYTELQAVINPKLLA